MRPLHHVTGHRCFDLSEGKLHRDESGRIFAFFPKKWTTLPAVEVETVRGERREFEVYLVTEWNEIELQPMDRSAK